jgi:ABC-type amino acid transport substrate-binding protein
MPTLTAMAMPSVSRWICSAPSPGSWISPSNTGVSNWDQAWNGLLAGELDALPLAARIREREGAVEYTSVHTVGYDAFFVRGGSPHIDAIEAARGRRIVVMQSDAAHHAIKGRGFADGQLMLVDELPEAMRLLAAGRADAVLAPLVQGTRILLQLGLEDAIQAGSPLKEYRREFAFAVKKGNVELRDRLEQGLLIVKTPLCQDKCRLPLGGFV